MTNGRPQAEGEQQKRWGDLRLGVACDMPPTAHTASPPAHTHTHTHIARLPTGLGRLPHRFGTSLPSVHSCLATWSTSSLSRLGSSKTHRPPARSPARRLTFPTAKGASTVMASLRSRSLTWEGGDDHRVQGDEDLDLDLGGGGGDGEQGYAEREGRIAPHTQPTTDRPKYAVGFR